MAVLVPPTPTGPLALQPHGIDPRLFLMVYDDLVGLNSAKPTEKKSETKQATKQYAPKRLQLPLTLLFRYQWQGPDGETYPIYADLVYVESHMMLHKIRENPKFPERFNGKTFEHLSTSALYMKPTEYNGYTAWYYQHPDGEFYTLQHARQLGFINSFHECPSMEPRHTRIAKDVLLRFADMAQVVHPHFMRNAGKGGGAKRRKRQVRPSTSEVMEHEIPTSSELWQQPWTQCHSVKAFLDYVVEVFPGHSREIRIAWSGFNVLSGMGPAAPFLLLSQVLEQVFTFSQQTQLHEAPPLMQLGAFVLWSMQTKGYVDCLQFATDCANIQTALQTRVRPKEFSLSLADCLQEFEPRKWFRLQPFSVTAEMISLFRNGVIVKNIRTTDVVDEVAHARHVAFNLVKLTVLQHTPKFFSYFSANDK
jgi:hypothetical protein